MRSGAVPKGTHMLLEVDSEPLLEIVRNMNKLSTNFVAEQIVKHMGGVFKGAPGSTAKGVAVIEDYVATLGIPRGSFVLENGSGLSSVSRVTAQQLVKVLVSAYHDREIRSEFMDSLSVLGVDGTMKSWTKMAPELAGIVFAKTGTLDGALEPLRVYLTCIQVLDAAIDPRATQVKQRARHLLGEQAAGIKDRKLRESFVGSTHAAALLAS